MQLLGFTKRTVTILLANDSHGQCGGGRGGAGRKDFDEYVWRHGGD